MTPIEMLDDLLNTVQTFPLDIQHYTKQIITHDKSIIKNNIKLKRVSKKILKHNQDSNLKKHKKYTRECKKSLNSKIKAVDHMSNIIKEIKEDIKKKISYLDAEEIEMSVLPNITNVPTIVRTGSRVRTNEVEPLYCICNEKSHGDMIGCDNSDCKVGWFHFKCVGLCMAPKGKWFCEMCKKNKKHVR